MQSNGSKGKGENSRVAVVGAGPVGVVCALALSKRGIPVTVFEQEPGPVEDQRAASIHPSTLELLDELGIVSSISSSYSPLEGAGVVGITAQLDPTNVDRVETEIVRELRRVRDGGVTEAERRRAITAAEAHHEFASETVEGRAQVLGRAETVWRLDGELGYLDRVRAVTNEQIRAAAIRYLDPERYVRVTFLPRR